MSMMITRFVKVPSNICFFLTEFDTQQSVTWKLICNVPSNICFFLKLGVFASGGLHLVGE